MQEVAACHGPFEPLFSSVQPKELREGEVEEEGKEVEEEGVWEEGENSEEGEKGEEVVYRVNYR